MIRSCSRGSKGKQTQGAHRMPGQRKAIGGCEEGGGYTGLQVFGARSCFSHREKERHKGRLDEAEMRATLEANSDRESSDTA